MTTKLLDMTTEQAMDELANMIAKLTEYRQELQRSHSPQTLIADHDCWLDMYNIGATIQYIAEELDYPYQHETYGVTTNH